MIESKWNRRFGSISLAAAMAAGAMGGYWLGRGEAYVAAGIFAAMAVVAIGAQSIARSRQQVMAVWNAYAEREIARARVRVS